MKKTYCYIPTKNIKKSNAPVKINPKKFLFAIFELSSKNGFKPSVEQIFTGNRFSCDTGTILCILCIHATGIRAVFLELPTGD